MDKKDKIDNLKKIEGQIEKAKQSGANLLLPSTNIGELSDFHAPAFDSVYLSANPKDGDVYPANYQDDCDEFRVTAQGLRKLSVCAGVMWQSQGCGRIDNRSDRNYVAFRSMGGIRKADGTPVWFRGDYDLDFEVIEEELTALYINKCKNWKKPDNEKQGYVDNNVKRDMLFKRKHRIKLAETGSMNRVIRAILGLKNSYTREELSKPFVMVRIVFRPDYNDKEVRRLMTEAAIKSMTGIYGVDTPPTNIEPSMEGDVIDVTPVPGEEPEPPPPETEPDNAESGDEPSALEVFLAGDEDADRIKHLEELAAKKGVDLEKIVTIAWKDFKDENFTKLFEHLMAQPDADYDEIPF